MNIKKVFIPLLGLLFVLLAFVPVQANNINNNVALVAGNNNLMMNGNNNAANNFRNNVAVNNTTGQVSQGVAQTWYDSYNLGMQMSSGLNTSGNIVNKNMMKNLT